MPILLLLLAAAIRDSGATVRAGCDPTTESVARLPAGQSVEVKFALAGEGCYKIATTIDGRSISGWLSGSDLSNTTDFDRARQSGTAVESQAIQTQAAASAPVELREALQAIEAHEPGRALAMLEPAAKTSRNPILLTLAGIAAWRNDEPRSALDYWRRSLDLHPDPQLDALYRKVERESAGDRSSGHMVGMRILLRYEPGQVTEEVARSMLLALDAEYSRISSQLGCGTRERIAAIVQSRDAYYRTTGAAVWSGGQYDGRIRVALMDNDGISAQTRRAFAHELVHACLASLGSWQAWLHEGLAQKLSGDALEPAEWDRIRPSIEAGQFPPLERLGDALRTAGTDRARAIYAIALRAADQLMSRTQAVGIRNLLANPPMLAKATADINRELGLTR